MKINLIRIIVSLLILCYLLFNINNKVEIKEDKIEFSSYEIGYNAGFNAAISQFSGEENLRVFLDPNKKVASYTSKINSNNEEEIRGYEDGYHKAISTIYCPPN